MLNAYLHLLEAINNVIKTSTIPVFIKDRENLILTKEEEKLLTNCFNVFNIFTKATTKLKGKY